MACLLPWRQPPISMPFLYPQGLQVSLLGLGHRYASSARRNQKRLRVKPDDSFTSATSPDYHADPVIHNPPSSAPSPYHTPPAFLPADDPRRTLHSQTFTHYNPYRDPTQPLPPLTRTASPPKKYHLKPADFEEIRRLRAEDPFTWTRKKLAEKYGCSQFFVGMVAETTEKKKKFEQEHLEKIKDRWGPKRRHAGEERLKRRQLIELDK